MSTLEFGSWVGRPCTHFAWLELIMRKNKKFYNTVNKRTHRNHPVCSTGRHLKTHKFVTSRDPAKVNCRSCLKRMAMEVAGESAWRRKIIQCYAKRAK